MKAIQVTDSILALQVEFDGVVRYLTVLVSGSRYMLIDAGLPKYYRVVIEALAGTHQLAGKHLFGIVVTSAQEHAVGNLSAFIADYPEISITGTHGVLDALQLPYSANLKFIADETVLAFNDESLVLVNQDEMLALYHVASQTMIAGNRLVVENGQLLPPTQLNVPILDFPIQQVIARQGGVAAGEQLAHDIAAIKNKLI